MTSKAFSNVAEQDGKVLEVNEELGLMKIQYKDGSEDVVEFGESFASISGSNIKQKKVLNEAIGKTFKQGDVLAYNEGFFTPDPDNPKQVAWKHGVPTRIALMELPGTLEDSCMISDGYSKKLSTSKGYTRTVSITKNTVIHESVKVGDEVETTTPLCIVEDALLDELSVLDEDGHEDAYLSALSKYAPKARNYGQIHDIQVLHSCPFNELHPSIQKLAKKSMVRQVKRSQMAEGTRGAYDYTKPSPVPIGTKLKGVDYAHDDVVTITYMIDQRLGCTRGDKLVVAAQGKTIIGEVLPKAPRSGSDGKNIDIIFGGSSIHNRILGSVMVMGIGNTILEDTEQKVLDMYFKDKK